MLILLVKLIALIIIPEIILEMVSELAHEVDFFQLCELSLGVMLGLIELLILTIRLELVQ